MEITFINVGYGDAILVREGGFIMLVDGGDDSDAEYAPDSGRVRCRDYLRSAGVKHIDIMVNTHIHEDHTCGLLEAADVMPVGEFWTPFIPELPDFDITEKFENDRSARLFAHSLNAYRRLAKRFSEQGVPVRALYAQKEEITLPGGITCDVLGPSRDAAQNMTADIGRVWREDDPLPLLRDMDARMNNVSLILRLGFKGKYALLVGDTNRSGFKHIDVFDTRLKADIFKIGHHGQKDGATEEMFRRIAPEFVVFTASSDRRYDSAHPDMIKMARDAGATPLFTDDVPGLSPGAHSSLLFDITDSEIKWTYGGTYE